MYSRQHLLHPHGATKQQQAQHEERTTVQPLMLPHPLRNFSGPTAPARLAPAWPSTPHPATQCMGRRENSTGQGPDSHADSCSDGETSRIDYRNTAAVRILLGRQYELLLLVSTNVLFSTLFLTVRLKKLPYDTVQSGR